MGSSSSSSLTLAGVSVSWSKLTTLLMRSRRRKMQQPLLSARPPMIATAWLTHPASAKMENALDSLDLIIEFDKEKRKIASNNGLRRIEYEINWKTLLIFA